MQKDNMQYLFDINGKKYLDCFGGILVNSLENCNPEINKKIKEQLDTLGHVSTVSANIPMIELAKRLADVTPGDLAKTFFCQQRRRSD